VKGVGLGKVSNKGLIVSCYGAYGMNGNCEYPIRWLPWLKNGYTLCIGMVRGGRENGDDWWKNGSTATKKINTFLDCVDVIQEAQKITGIKPSNTILHGRSAGGWNATYVGQKYNYLIGAIYAEVPYVDVLRTTTNPDLPLTKLEYDEFGDPLHKPEDFKQLMKISPMNNIPSGTEGSDMPFVLCRTGFYDRQVAPYEILKYATRLREKGWHCLVGFDKKSGHFAKMSDLFQQRGEDAAILDMIVGANKFGHSRTHSAKRPRLSNSIKHFAKH
jgi:oligopeptidase B